MLYKLFEHLYAPFLMKKWVRATVIVLFFGWACASVAMVPKIEIGLDQEISMPDNSFMLKYFTFLKVTRRINTGIIQNKRRRAFFLIPVFIYRYRRFFLKGFLYRYRYLWCRRQYEKHIWNFQGFVPALYSSFYSCTGK
jgi:hypothetical protein